jgi:hypothetical protein
MKRFNSFCLGLLILFNGFTDVVVYNNFPVLIYGVYLLVGCCVGIMACSGVGLNVKNRSYYAVLVLIVIVACISCMLGDKTQKSLTYLGWFIWVFVAYGVIGKLFIDTVGLFDVGIRYIRISLVVHSLLAIVDWAASNSFLPFSPINMLRADSDFNSAIFGLVRLRGGVEEAAHYAMYLQMFFSISLLAPWASKVRFITYIIVVGISYLATFSLSSWICLLCALAISITALLPTKRSTVLAVALSFFLSLGLLAVFIQYIDNELVFRLFDQDDISRIHRTEIYSVALDGLKNVSVLEIFFGRGPASFIEKNHTNPISWYFHFAYDLGFPSVTLAVLTGLITWYNVFVSKLSNIRKFWAQVAVIAPFLQYTITGNFWHPWVWTSMALILETANRSNLANCQQKLFQPSKIGLSNN